MYTITIKRAVNGWIIESYNHGVGPTVVTQDTEEMISAVATLARMYPQSEPEDAKESDDTKNYSP